MKETLQFDVAFARRLPDPNFKKSLGAEKHIFLVACRKMPIGVGDKPNARRPNVRKRIYQDVEKSLLNQDCEPGTFHLKNKGITIIADSVTELGNGKYGVTMDMNLHGIVDGGHTYRIIMENRDDIPEDQFVQVEVRVGIPLDWIPDISGGLNTSVQVQDMSLDDLKGRFQWLKSTLGPVKREHVAWTENETGVGKVIDARDLVSIMCLLNPALWPNEESKHPIVAYTSKAKALQVYEENQAAFERMSPIVQEILELHDHIAATAKDIWNRKKSAKGESAKGGHLAFMEKKSKGKFEFPFAEERAEFRLHRSALYPILAAFRWFVVQDQVGDLKIRWKIDFADIRKFWSESGLELLEITHDANNELGRSQTALGKNSNYWKTLHATVGMRSMQMLMQQAS